MNEHDSTNNYMRKISFAPWSTFCPKTSTDRLRAELSGQRLRNSVRVCIMRSSGLNGTRKELRSCVIAYVHASEYVFHATIASISMQVYAKRNISYCRIFCTIQVNTSLGFCISTFLIRLESLLRVTVYTGELHPIMERYINLKARVCNDESIHKNTNAQQTELHLCFCLHHKPAVSVTFRWGFSSAFAFFGLAILSKKFTNLLYVICSEISLGESLYFSQ